MDTIVFAAHRQDVTRSSLLAFAACVALAAGPLSRPAASASEGTTAIELCGTLKEHREATASAAGNVAIGTRAYAVAPDTKAGNAGVEIGVGRDLCLTGSVGGTSGHLVRYTFFWMPPDGQVCGNVLSASETAAVLSADFGELPLKLATGVVATAQGRMRECFAVEVERPSGDLRALRREAADTTNEREWAWHCGTVRSYTPATPATSGSIEIGSKSWRIGSGTRYTGDPAGDRTDRTTVGANMCLRATLGDAHEVIEYLTRPMDSQTGGTASEYTPPSGDRPGVIVLSYRSHFELKVPASIADSVDLGRGSYCYTVGVDTAGDAIATELIPCDQVGVGGGGAQATPTPTATAIPTATATPSGTAIPTPTASTSPTPPPAAEPTAAGASAEQSTSPLLIAAVALLALAIAAVVLTRRGKTHR